MGLEGKEPKKSQKVPEFHLKILSPSPKIHKKAIDRLWQLFRQIFHLSVGILKFFVSCPFCGIKTPKKGEIVSFVSVPRKWAKM